MGGACVTVKNLFLQRHHLLVLLLLVLTANITPYYTSFGVSVLPEHSKGVVIGSMIDLALVTPFLFIAWRQRWTVRNVILAIALGLILVRFLIPIEYLEPFVAITWVGFAVEGAIVFFDIFLLFILIKHLPKIVHSVKNNSLPTIFSFADAMDGQMKSTSLIKVICTEMLMFYYAFGSWRTKTIERENTFTLYKHSSLIALYIMVIHSIILETIALHWWLHGIFPVVSIVLLILNIYSIIFFIGNIQAIRHNPIQISQRKIYLSFGLMKRMKVDLNNIKRIIDEPTLLQKKLSRDTIDFIARDFEDVSPHMILELKKPVKTNFIFGIQKEYKFIAIRADEPNRLKAVIIASMAIITYDEIN